MRNFRLYRTEAIVLKRGDFGEADRLLTVFTPSLGKLRLIAKGVRRPISKMAGHLELFAHSQLLIARGRNLDIITQSDTVTSLIGLRDDLLRMTYAHYLAELVERFTPDHLENYPLYRTLLDALKRLDAEPQPEVAVRMAEMQMLQHLGYRPQLQACVHCREDLKPTENAFAARLGGVLCPNCGRMDASARSLSLNALKVLRLLQRGDYATASQLRPDEPLQREVEAHLRSLLHYHLEQAIKSTAFLNRLRAEGVSEG